VLPDDFFDLEGTDTSDEETEKKSMAMERKLRKVGDTMSWCVASFLFPVYNYINRQLTCCPSVVAPSRFANIALPVTLDRLYSAITRQPKFRWWVVMHVFFHNRNSAPNVFFIEFSALEFDSLSESLWSWPLRMLVMLKLALEPRSNGVPKTRPRNPCPTSRQWAFEKELGTSS
jgi:hypothetical protein